MVMALARSVLRAGGGRHIVRVRNALIRDRNEALSVKHGSKRLTWYACGPTVYDDAHLGHARTYIAFDVARRILSTLARIRVDFCMGVTDVDDKIIARAQQNGISPRQLARQYENRFFADMNALNIQPPNRIVRVTEHIPDIVRVIAELVESDAAYTTSDGSVYFNINNAQEYGVFNASSASNNDETQTETKLDSRDFALWKGGTGNVNPEYARWDSPWGVGRPGWHVECTAMIRASLGDHIDVHSGGMDLKFPHHENELVIANELRDLCGCSIPRGCGDNDDKNERWVHTWIHAGQLEIGGLKMSKSTKNFVTVRDYLNDGGDPDVFRMFCLKHRYGAPVEFNADRVRDAENFLGRCRRFVGNTRLHGLNENADYSSKSVTAGVLINTVEKCREAIEEALVDDFDTPRALNEIAMLMTSANRVMNTDGATALVCAEAGQVVTQVLGMLGLSDFEQARYDSSDTETVDDFKIDERLLDELVIFRNMIRNAAMAREWGRVFKACDSVRSVLRDRFGVEVRDGDNRTSWERVGPGSTSPFTGRKRPVTTEINSDSDD